MRLPPPPPRPDLDAMLKASVNHELTPGERWDQTVSFVYGNLPDGNPTTREQIEAGMIETHGPRPEK